jgi:hypothetical protein
MIWRRPGKKKRFIGCPKRCVGPVQKPIFLNRPVNATHVLPKVQQHQAAECYKTCQYNPIPSLLRPYAPNQAVYSRDLTRCSYDPPVYTGQGLPLNPKILIDRICLIYDTVNDAVAVIYPPALLQHVLRLCFGRVGGAVGVDV